MTLEPGEVQILKGPGLVVTDRRVICGDEQFNVASIGAPQVEQASVQVSVGPTLFAIGGALVLAGALAGQAPVWIGGLAVATAGTFAKIKRTGFTVSVETSGERKVIYTTAKDGDAKLAFAAVTEALRRATA